MKKLLILALLAIIAPKVATAASWFNWQEVAGVASGIITDTAHWSSDPAGSTSPDDYLQFSLAAEYTVTIPQGSAYTSLMRPFITAHDGHAVTFDGDGASWTQPASPSGNYNASRIQFRLAAPDVSNADIFLIQGTADTYGGFKMTNPLIKAIGEDSPAYRLDFLRGTYNFYDPNGTARSMSAYLRGVTGVTDATVRFGEGASFTVHELKYGVSSNARAFVFDGGTHIIHNGISFDASAAGRSRLLATNGAELQIPAAVALAATHPFDFQVESNAVLKITGSKTFKFGNDAAAADYDAKLTVSNAVIVVDEGSSFNNYGKMEVVNSRVSAAKLNPYSGVSCFKDSAVTSAYDDVAYDATIIVDGGIYVSTDVFRMNYNGSGSALVVTNGGEFVYSKTIDSPDISRGATSSSSIFVRGGKFKTVDYTGITVRPLLLGRNGGTGTTTLELSSGEIALGNRPLSVGGRDVTVTVSGGTYQGSSIFFNSYENSSDHESLFHQTGGEIALSPYSTYLDGGYYAVTNQQGRTRLKLEGGSFTAPFFCGASSSGHSAIEADGGTVKPIPAPSADGFIFGFDEAKLGAKGLTVEADYAVTIPQAFTDKEGEDGALILAGEATKTLTGSSSVAKIVAAKGRTALAAGSACTSRLIVTNGAEIAFGDAAAAASLAGATFGDATSAGVLVATSGVTPVIGGEVDIVNLKLSLAGGFANYTTNAVLAATSFTAGSLEALARATAMAGLPSGAAASFAIEEGQDGKQYLNMALTDVQTLVIYVDEGTSNVTDNVIYPASAELQTIVAAGATLAISGNVGYGSLAHSGDGTLLLSSADNAFYGDVTSSGGTFSVSALAALSDDSVLPRETFTLTSGTLELSDSADPATFPRELVADAASASDAVVIKTDTGVTVEDATSLARTGAIVKRGAGKFTVTSAANPLAISAGNGIAAKNAYPTTSSTLTFGTDGKAGGTYYTGFTVAEGAAEFVGNGADALFSSSDNVAIGLPCSTGSADAGLTVRDAKLQANWMLLGCGLAAGNTFMTAPYLAATNATISADTFAAAYNSTLTALRPKVTLNASELNVSFLLRANHAGNNTTIASAYDLAAGSLLATPRMGIVRKAEFDCDASTIAVTQLFCKAASYYEKNGSTYADSYGIFRLRNGSTLHTRDIEPSSSGSAASPLTFEFDDSEWIPTAGISADYAFSFTNAANLAIIATSGGLILSPGSELTWSVVHPVTGANGRIVKRGAGTLAFTGLNALAVGGTNEVEAGTFAVTATSVVASVKAHLASGTTLDLLGGTHVGAVVSGSGTVRNGTLSAATVPVRLADGTAQETLTFAFDDGCSLAQSLTFDLGCSEDEPFEPGSGKVVLARYTGIVPDGIGWNLSNIGVRQKFGDFEFADGEIRAGLKNAQGTAIFLK